MSRLYELMFIVRPDVAEEEVDKLIEKLTTAVTEGGGVLKSAEKMGRRKLAYMVRKFADGFYVLATIEAEGSLILELERRLRVNEQVIKFITVRTDEEEKRQAKIKAIRQSRRKLSDEPVAAAPVAAAPVVAAPAPAVAAPAAPAAEVAAAPAAEAAPANA